MNKEKNITGQCLKALNLLKNNNAISIRDIMPFSNNPPGVIYKLRHFYNFDIGDKLVKKRNLSGRLVTYKIYFLNKKNG